MKQQNKTKQKEKEKIIKRKQIKNRKKGWRRAYQRAASTHCWLKDSFAVEDLVQVDNKNCINRHVVLFLN